MVDKITKKEVEEIYKQLKKSQKDTNWDNDEYYDFSKKSDHIAWKPITI